MGSVGLSAFVGPRCTVTRAAPAPPTHADLARRAGAGGVPSDACRGQARQPRAGAAPAVTPLLGAATAAAGLVAARGLGAAAGRVRASGRSLAARRRRPRSSAAVVVARKGAIDAAGDRWETPFTKVGPEIEEVPADMPSRWKTGTARFRVAFHAEDRITAMDWHQETVCFGTRSGIVRAVDLESGSVVGDYYKSSHMRPQPIESLLFDGDLVAAGDTEGKLSVWRAQLAGSWAYNSAPNWRMSRGGSSASAHSKPVTGIVAFQDGSEQAVLASASRDGTVVAWKPLCPKTEVVEPLAVADLGSPVQALCVGEDGATLLAATEDGKLHKLALGAKDKFDVLVLMTLAEPGGISSLALDCHTGALFIGMPSGRLLHAARGAPMAKELTTFHGGAVTKLAIRRDQSQVIDIAFTSAEENTEVTMEKLQNSKRVVVKETTGPKLLAGDEIIQMECEGKLFATTDILPPGKNKRVLHTAKAGDQGLVLRVKRAPRDNQQRILLSTGEDGRVTAWDADHLEPLWALQDLDGERLIALLDRSRLVCSGVVVNAPTAANVTGGVARNLVYDFTEPVSIAEGAAPCEGVLCLDFCQEPGSHSKHEEHEYWPEAVTASA